MRCRGILYDDIYVSTTYYVEAYASKVARVIKTRGAAANPVNSSVDYSIAPNEIVLRQAWAGGGMKAQKHRDVKSAVHVMCVFCIWRVTFLCLLYRCVVLVLCCWRMFVSQPCTPTAAM
jgi:hypothetical protein